MSVYFSFGQVSSGWQGYNILGQNRSGSSRLGYDTSCYNR
jgi:hypothetical protein